jgi:uncharacterized membrane protein
MMRAKAQTAVVGLATIVAIATTLAPTLAPLRPYLALPLVIVLPGLAGLRAALPRSALSFEILVLSCGLSLAISIVVGLLLNVGGFLTPPGWVGSLGGLTLVSCAAHLLRTPSPDPLVVPAGERFHVTLSQAAMFSAAALIALFGIGAARVGAMRQREYSFTEFWMAPLKPAEQNVVTIGIRNEEKVTTGYRVVIVADGAVIGRWPPVSLDPGATWSMDISLNSEMQRSQRVEAWLYRDDEPKEVYRKVWLASSANLNPKRDRTNAYCHALPILPSRDRRRGTSRDHAQRIACDSGT